MFFVFVFPVYCLMYYFNDIIIKCLKINTPNNGQDVFHFSNFLLNFCGNYSLFFNKTILFYHYKKKIHLF